MRSLHRSCSFVRVRLRRSVFLELLKVLTGRRLGRGEIWREASCANLLPFDFFALNQEQNISTGRCIEE